VKKTVTGMPDIEDYWAAFGEDDSTHVSDSDSDAGVPFIMQLEYNIPRFSTQVPQKIITKIKICPW
jgi:hypothetical protein